MHRLGNEIFVDGKVKQSRDKILSCSKKSVYILKELMK